MDSELLFSFKSGVSQTVGRTNPEALNLGNFYEGCLTRRWGFDQLLGFDFLFLK